MADRSSYPRFEPNTQQSEETYVLTLMTDKRQHQILSDLRKKYFPPKLNKLQAHLTLFHALPGSKLESDIIPVLEKSAQSLTSFHIMVTTPFQMSSGIAIGVPKSAGGDNAREIHKTLKQQWHDFLSEQDRGGFAAHYTIMNKVDDRTKVGNAFAEVQESFKTVKGSVDGFELFRYVKGHWEFVRNFRFQPNDATQ